MVFSFRGLPFGIQIQLWIILTFFALALGCAAWELSKGEKGKRTWFSIFGFIVTFGLNTYTSYDFYGGLEKINVPELITTIILGYGVGTALAIRAIKNRRERGFPF